MLKSSVFLFAMFTTACVSTTDEETPVSEEEDVTPVSSDAVVQTAFCADLVVVDTVKVPCFLPNGGTGTQSATRTCTTDRWIIVSPAVPPVKSCGVGATTCTYAPYGMCK
jgi:hypothetical protein